MVRYEFRLPDVGEGVAESEIAAWRVAVGDRVHEDQPLADMLTDKAAVEVPSPVSGVVLECRGAVGDRVAVGATLVVIQTDIEHLETPDTGDAVTPARGPDAPAEEARDVVHGPDATRAATKPTEATHVGAAAAARLSRARSATHGSTFAPAPGDDAAAAPDANHLPRAAPALRKLAREQGVDLHRVPGSGPRGRITPSDYQAFVAGQASATGHVANGPDTTPDSALPAEVDVVRVVGLRRRIAEAMQQSVRQAAHFSYVEETDVTELEALRRHLNEQRRPEQPRLTLLPFLIRALVRVLPQHPQINARYDDQAGLLHRHRVLHVGVATQTPQGLMVPVIRHAQRLDLWQLAAEITRLSSAAREGRARREELSGSTLTLSSLGAWGGLVSTPILNLPEVAIVGVNRIVERAVFRGGAVVPRLTMNLSSSFDHRVVDGWDAAAFIQALRAVLEHPATLFMA